MSGSIGGGGGGFAGGADTLSDADKATLFNANLGYTFTLTEGGRYHSIPLGASFRPWRWLLASLTLPVSFIDAEETYNDEILLGGVPTPRETTIEYSAAGLGDVSLSAWADCAHLLSQPWKVGVPVPAAGSG